MARKKLVTIRVLPGCVLRLGNDTWHAGYELAVSDQDAKALEHAGIAERVQAGARVP